MAVPGVQFAGGKVLAPVAAAALRVRHRQPDGHGPCRGSRCRHGHGPVGGRASQVKLICGVSAGLDGLVTRGGHRQALRRGSSWIVALQCRDREWPQRATAVCCVLNVTWAGMLLRANAGLLLVIAQRDDVGKVALDLDRLSVRVLPVVGGGCESTCTDCPLFSRCESVSTHKNLYWTVGCGVIVAGTLAAVAMLGTVPVLR